ncbi:ABC transporter permease [Bacillus tianshenii]|nr:ABC transporter permease [Bacillus tianshenii]
MKIFKAFKLAVYGLWANRFRVFLSMLGIVIGVFAVIVLTSIAVGVKDTIAQQMGGLGAEQVMVVPGRVLSDGGGAQNFLQGMTNVSSTLTNKDAEEISKVKSVGSVTPHLETVTRAYYKTEGKKRTVEGKLIGTSENYQDVIRASLDEGRFMKEEEVKSGKNVVVLGSSVHDALLNKKQKQQGSSSEGGSSKKTWLDKVIEFVTGEQVSAAKQEKTLIGQQVTINGEEFKVIGVLESKASIGTTTNNNIIMPVKSALNITNMKNLTTIYAEVKNLENIEQTEKQIYSAVAKNHSEADFSIVKQKEMLKAIDKVTKILQMMLFGITVTALFISGTGIMNVMIMSVRERTKEIGIRKALGATTMEVLWQFLFETLLLCTIGGLIGVALGMGFIELWNENIAIFSLVLPIWAVKLAVYCSIIIGGVFGLYPAFKAAKLQPSRALRYE